jgi:hypothetical protein
MLSKSDIERKDKEEFDRVFHSEISGSPELSGYTKLLQNRNIVYRGDLLSDILEILDKENKIIRDKLLDRLS